MFELTNDTDRARKYTYHVRVAVADRTTWQVSVSGEATSPEEACARIVNALDEIRVAVDKVADSRSSSVEVAIEIDEPKAPPVAVSHVGGVVVVVQEAGAGLASVPRPEGWPRGDTF
jgi:hypothetical protein